MNAKLKVGVCLAGISGFGVWAGAQAPAVSAPVQDHTITLDVVVTDKSGKAMPGLKVEDFTVLDNKVKEKIDSFRAHGGPGVSAADAQTQVFIVLDGVNATYDRMTFEREQVGKFLRQNGGQLNYPTSLCFFLDTGIQIQARPSFDGNAMADAMEKQPLALRNTGRGDGQSGQEDRFKESLDAMDALIARSMRSKGRKMVIWLSPGWRSRPSYDLASSFQEKVYAGVLRYSAQLRAARMTVYSIDPLGAEGAGDAHTKDYLNFTKGLYKTSDAELGDLGLHVMVSQTGGVPIFGDTPMEKSLNRCIADLSAFYTLTVDEAPVDKGHDYHGLEVKVEGEGLQTRTRTGYYTPALAAR